MHKLNLNGQFTKNDMNMWINQLIPDLPVIDEETVNYTFQNVLTKNYLMIKYKNK